jgi:hypothetical protein
MLSGRSSPIDENLNARRNDLIWQFLEIVLASIVWQKIAERAVFKWSYIQQAARPTINDRVFVENGSARYKPASRRLVAGILLTPAVYVFMAF